MKVYNAKYEWVVKPNDDNGVCLVQADQADVCDGNVTFTVNGGPRQVVAVFNSYDHFFIGRSLSEDV